MDSIFQNVSKMSRIPADVINKNILKENNLIQSIKQNDLIKIKQIFLNEIENGDFFGWTPLHHAAQSNSYEAAKYCLEQPNSDTIINKSDKFNVTPLVLACVHGDLDLVKLFLQYEADPNKGFPLHHALKNNHNDCVVELLKNGADVNLRDNSGEPPIFPATVSENIDAIRILVEDNHADINKTNLEFQETALHKACRLQLKLSVIQELIRLGANVNLVDKFEMTPMREAVIQNCKLEIIQFLIENRADVNIRDNCGQTDLFQTYNKENLKIILEHTHDINARDIDNETALCSFTKSNKRDLCEILLSFNADVNIPCYGGWTPLHITCSEGNIDLVKIFLKYNANVNVISHNNMLPLHLAAAKGHLKIVQELVENGTNLNLRIIHIDYIQHLYTPYFIEDITLGDYSPVEIAAINGNEDVVEFLLSKGAGFEQSIINGISEEKIRKLFDKTDYSKKTSYQEKLNVIQAIVSNKLNLIDSKTDLNIQDLLGWSPLHHAVYQNNYKAIEKLLENKINVNIEDNFNRTPLTIAAIKNNVELIKILLNQKAEINHGLPLNYATKYNNYESIIELIQQGADVNLKNRYDLTPIMIAIQNENLKAVSFLIQNGSNLQIQDDLLDYPIHKAVLTSNSNILNELLKYTTEVNVKSRHEETPLIYAINSYANVKILLEHGADINSTDNSQWSALHFACEEENTENIKQLIEHNADLEAKTNEMKTPLFYTSSNFDNLKMLLENNVNVNSFTSDGFTTLHYSCHFGDLNCVQELVKFNADVNSFTIHHCTPIHISAYNGSYEICKFLLESSAFVNVATKNFVSCSDRIMKVYVEYPGSTPLHFAVHRNHLNIVELLVNSGAPINIGDRDGNTPLHKAIFVNNLKMVKILVEKCPECVNIKNKQGKLPIDMKKKKKIAEIVEYLNNLTL